MIARPLSSPLSSRLSRPLADATGASWRRPDAVWAASAVADAGYAGGETVTYTEALPRTRASSAWQRNAASAFYEAEAASPRFSYAEGLLLGDLCEEAAAEQLVNTAAGGAVVGRLNTGGALPTGWSTVGSSSEMEIVAIEDAGAHDIVRIRVDSPAVGINDIVFQTAIAAAPGQSWTASIYLAVVEIAEASFGQWQIELNERDAANAYKRSLGSILVPTSVGALEQYVISGVTGAETARLDFKLRNNHPAAQDATIDICLPSVIQKPFVTSPIITTGSAATREADVAIASLESFESEGVILIEWEEVADTGAERVLFSVNSGTTAERLDLVLTAGDTLALSVESDSASDTAAIEASPSLSARHRAAIGYSASGASASLDGASVQSIVHALAPALWSQLDVANRLGAASLNGHLREIQVIPGAWSAATLQSLAAS